jgi:hypothetical protein
MKSHPLTLLCLWILVLPVQAGDCSTAFVCDVVNYQRMYLDGRMEELPPKSFGFQMKGKELVPQQGANRRRAWDPCRSPVEAWIMPLPPSMRSNLSENSCALI